MHSDGTKEMICRLVESYSDMLLRLAAARLDSPTDAEDCVQEVFLTLLAHPVVFQSAEHERAWLIRTTIHRACDMRRAQARRPVPVAEVAETTQGRVEEECGLLSAVRALPEKYSAVIHLHYYEGFSIAEIGKLLHLPAATVGTRLARGRKKLALMLKEEP